MKMDHLVKVLRDERNIVRQLNLQRLKCLLKLETRSEVKKHTYGMVQTYRRSRVALTSRPSLAPNLTKPWNEFLVASL